MASQLHDQAALVTLWSPCRADCESSNVC